MAESREKSERERFEEWACGHFVRIPTGMNPVERISRVSANVQYVHNNVQQARAAWEAGRRDALEEAAKIVEELRGDGNYETAMRFAARRIREAAAIRALK